jgi:sorting nexin-9/18/33
MSKAERELAYSLLSLVTAHPLHSVSESEDEPDATHRPHEPGLVNEDGAWCWRDHCDGQHNPTCSGATEF